MDYASNEELYFALWISELQSVGIITKVTYQPKSFVLSNDLQFEYIKALKTKTKKVLVTLLQNHEYQADFLIFWNNIAHKKIFINWNDQSDTSYKSFPFIANYSEKTGKSFSVIDVKGTFNQNDAWRRFSIDQKWVFQKHGIYVQKTIVHPAVSKSGKMTPSNALFPNTFLPKRFQLTDRTMKKRKIKYKYKLLEEYLKDINIQL